MTLTQDGGTARYAGGDGWYVEGRVPNPWHDVTMGPFDTARDAGEAGRERRLGGRHLFQVREGRRVV